MYISLEKQLFRLLVTFSLIFVADTKIIFGYDFVAPLRYNSGTKSKKSDFIANYSKIIDGCA